MIRNFWRMNLGLIKYLIKELPKKTTPKEIIKFLKPIIKQYFRQLLQLYKTLFLLFDEDYQKQKKQYDNYQKIKIDLQRALKLLKYIDTKMAKSGKNRQERRGFWKEFFKDGIIRNEVFNQLQDELK